MTIEPTPADRARVRDLLGREPQGRYRIVVRDAAGDPVVLRNSPLLDDGTPMPTRYWLVGPDEVRRIGRLEADGGVDAAEADVDPDELADAHARYAAERDAEIPEGHVGPRPSGGVGGTRTGVKCLHAHWAWHLAGGDDPVGRWIERRLEQRLEQDGAAPVPRSRPAPDRLQVHVTADETLVDVPSGATASVPWGDRNLSQRWFSDADPPHPASLTNALGAVDDHLDDVEREHPSVVEIGGVSFAGDPIAALARLEVGADEIPTEVTLSRRAAEEIFRIVATESAADRAHNPGLPSRHVHTIVATCCIVVAVMRRFHLDEVTLMTDAAATAS